MNTPTTDEAKPLSTKKQIDTLRNALVKCGKKLADYAIIITREQDADLSREKKSVGFDYAANLYICVRAKDMVIIPVAHLTDEMEMTWGKR